MTLPKNVDDLLIVGGGPAGLSTAISYIEHGGQARVTVLEALQRPNRYDSRYPGGGHSMCSGGLGRHMLDMIQADDPAWRIPPSVIMAPINRAILRGPHSRVELTGDLVGLGNEPVGVVTDRKKLDDWLLTRAIRLGVDYKSGFRASVIATHGDGWCANASSGNHLNTLSVNMGARALDHEPEVSDNMHHAYGDFIVGADGPESMVATACFGAQPVHDDDMFLANEVYVPRPDDGVFPSDAIEILFDPQDAPIGRGLKGYYWTFSGGNVVKVGCGTTRASTRANGSGPKLNPAAETEWWCRQKAHETGRREYVDGWKHPVERVGGRITGAKPLPVVADARYGCALVGEAGRAVWASIGAGDASAIETGRRLGEALARGKPDEYQRWWASEHYGMLKRHWRLKNSLLKLTNHQIDRAITRINDYRPRTTNTRSELPRLMLYLLRHEPWLLGRAAIAALRP